jgi:hypothetical protein
VQPAGESVLDPVIEVVSPAGEQIAVAHDPGPAHSAATVLISIPVAGVYRVRISAYANQSVGNYELSLEAALSTIVPVSRVTAVAIDVRFEITLAPGAQHTYAFRGAQGQTVDIEALAKPGSGFDPLIELIGPSGRRAAAADDSSPTDADARLTVVLDDGDGIYTVRISGYALMGGPFTLTIHSPAPP